MKLDDIDFCLLRHMWDAKCKNFIRTDERPCFRAVYFTPDDKMRRVRRLVQEELMKGEIGTLQNGQPNFQGITVTDKGETAWSKRIVTNGERS
ncbi:hypothetical protein [Vreelandella venusta]|uniref:Uncharacterized protein n=1 Tax=Vreelandella venusta TaxID=44935 RepID=A0ABX2BBE1_9GAMM|nr:hypothetical protein [Halomonas venusta]NPT30621.1 hypothetical protein [Halomonas venusta]